MCVYLCAYVCASNMLQRELGHIVSGEMRCVRQRERFNVLLCEELERDNDVWSLRAGGTGYLVVVSLTPLCGQAVDTLDALVCDGAEAPRGVTEEDPPTAHGGRHPPMHHCPYGRDVIARERYNRHGAGHTQRDATHH